jgi:hypothetical protein
MTHYRWCVTPQADSEGFKSSRGGVRERGNVSTCALLACYYRIKCRENSWLEDNECWMSGNTREVRLRVSDGYTLRAPSDS